MSLPRYLLVIKPVKSCLLKFIHQIFCKTNFKIYLVLKRSRAVRPNRNILLPCGFLSASRTDRKAIPKAI